LSGANRATLRRAAGCRNKATQIAEALLDGDVEALTRKVVW
jgi:hypothetical protein